MKNDEQVGGLKGLSQESLPEAASLRMSFLGRTSRSVN